MIEYFDFLFPFLRSVIANSTEGFHRDVKSVTVSMYEEKEKLKVI